MVAKYVLRWGFTFDTHVNFACFLERLFIFNLLYLSWNIFLGFEKNSETFYRYSSCLVRNLAMGRAFGGPAALCFVNQFVRPNAIALN